MAAAVTAARPDVAAIATVVTIAGAALIRRPVWVVYVTVPLAFVALPASIPRSVPVGPLVMYLYEPLLIVAALWVFFTHRQRAKLGTAPVLFAVVLAVATIAGLVAGNPVPAVAADVRGPAIMMVGFFVAARLAGTPIVGRVLVALKWSLWVSLAFIVVSSATGLALSGRAEEATLHAASGGGTTRFITPATHISLAVVCGVVALLITRRATFRQVAPYMLPALGVVFFSFSRNSLLGIGVAVIVTLIADCTARSVMGTLGRAAAAVGVVALLVWISRVLTDVPVFGWVDQQVSAFTARVIDGFSPSALAIDTSAQYRVHENAYLLNSAAESPMLGHGMGHAFRPPSGNVGSFTATAGIYYAHNFYYWLLVKAGAVGLAVFAWMALPAIVRRRATAMTATWLACAAAAAGLLASSIVAPMPLGFESASALALGAALGVAAVERRRAPAQDPAVDSTSSPTVNA